MKIVITGGHFSPALAVIKALPKDTKVLVLGRKYPLEGDLGLSYEYQVCRTNEIPFKEIAAARFQRKINSDIFFPLLKIPQGFTSSFKALSSFKPDVVLTFGGYVALPAAAAARILGIPIIVHEQTQEAGAANKLIGKFAEKVCISFESSRKYFPTSKTILTGNPLRNEIYTVQKKFSVPDGIPILYITGGSTGSHVINEFIIKLLLALLDKYCVIHQTGDSREYNDFEALESIRKTLPENLQKRYILKKIILPDEIGWIMKHADLIISRAGINTVLEMLSMKKRFILIPLPYGQKHEQLKNARLAVSTGLGEFILQEDVSPDLLYNTIQKILTHKKEYQEKQDVSDFILPDAAQNIVNSIQLIHAQKSQETAKL